MKRRNIQAMLYKELDNLIKGSITTKQARAVTEMSAQIIYVDRLELEDIRAKTDIKRLAKQPLKPKRISNDRAK